MTNLIQFPKDDDFKNVSYIEDSEGLGVSLRNRSLAVYRLNKDEFEIVTELGGSFVLDRVALSEFLHVAQVFVDPENKYRPDLEMISCDY